MLTENEITIPDEHPTTLDEYLEILGDVKYGSYGFPIVFLTRIQSDLIKNWEVTFRNPIHFTNQDFKSNTPLEACKQTYDWLLKLKKEGKKI